MFQYRIVFNVELHLSVLLITIVFLAHIFQRQIYIYIKLIKFADKITGNTQTLKIFITQIKVLHRIVASNLFLCYKPIYLGYFLSNLFY